MAKLSVDQTLSRAKSCAKKGEIKEAQKLYHNVLEAFPKNGRAQKGLDAIRKLNAPTTVQNPPQELLTKLVEYYQNRRFSDAEKIAAFITQNFPNHQFAWKILGAVLGVTGREPEALNANQTAVVLSPQDSEAHNNLGITLKGLGRFDEAAASCKKAIELKPTFAEAHCNLGITLKKLGRSEEALASYTQAIALKPDYAEAYYNLGITLQGLDRLDKAETSFKKTIALKPNFAEAHNNLGNTLQDLGRLEEALASYTQAIALKPNFAEACVNLGILIKKIRFNSSNLTLYTPLTQMLTAGNFVRPTDVVSGILSLLKHDTHFKDFELEKNPTLSLKKATSIIKNLDKLPLLHHLMRLCPLPELQFEKLFVAIRKILLVNLDKIEASPELIYFLSTISLHCFVNEYVYAESDEEIFLVEELKEKITQTVVQSDQPEVTNILCLASYRPLHQYDWCQKLKCLDSLEEVKKRLIEEPLLEKMIAKDIPMLGEVSNDVSLKVREQYEENPYPRWVKLAASKNAKPIAAICDELKLKINSENIKDIAAPSILIAGCGTGQHSIETASRFLNCHVTAVDLSLASLAYAKRKSNELHLANIDYLQADILHLHQMGKEFDLIESGGVLHHMDDPMVGWKVLVDLLKPGGLMKIGLYSELARHHVVKVREEIAALKVGTLKTDIRRFRQRLKESIDERHHLLTKSSDFFTLSAIRDLIFHVQEHRFTLPQIKSCLDGLGLSFCGFENQNLISNFRELNRNKADIYDLDLWHEYEKRNPQAFTEMYQFWCQKA